MEEVIKMALKFAADKYAKSLLVWEIPAEFFDDEEEEAWWTTPRGDKETLYTIADMFANERPDVPFGLNHKEAEDILIKALCKEYPTFVEISRRLYGV